MISTLVNFELERNLNQIMVTMLEYPIKISNWSTSSTTQNRQEYIHVAKPKYIKKKKLTWLQQKKNHNQSLTGCIQKVMVSI